MCIGVNIYMCTHTKSCVPASGVNIIFIVNGSASCILFSAPCNIPDKREEHKESYLRARRKKALHGRDKCEAAVGVFAIAVCWSPWIIFLWCARRSVFNSMANSVSAIVCLCADEKSLPAPFFDYNSEQ